METKKIQAITGWFIIAVVIAIAVYDVWAYTGASTEGTISYIMVDWAHRFPAFTFAMGFTCGHLFWPLKKMPESAKK